MNDRHIKSLEEPYKQCFNRLDSKAEIKEFQRFYESSQMFKTNPFLNYAITDKDEANSYDLPKKTDEIDYQQLMFRLTDSLAGAVRNKKIDNMVIDTMFNLLDEDKDGFIGIDDILSMRGQLGWGEEIDKDVIGNILQKTSEEGDKLTKKQFTQIFWL